MKPSLWICVPHQNGRPDPVGLELLGKGRALAESAGMVLEAVVLGAGAAPAAKALLEHGPSTVYVLDDPRLETGGTPVRAYALAELAKRRKPEVLLLSALREDSALASRAAARLGTGLSAHCVDLKFDGSSLIQTVPGFGGNVMANIVCPDRRPQMATVAPGVFAPVPGRAPGAKVVREKVSLPRGLRGVRTLSVRAESDGSGPAALKSARVVVAGGHGVGSRKDWALLEDLARALGGAVGATRPPVDEGWAKTRQMIGASGISIKPRLYIGAGISGMMHHTVGIQGAKTIVAVNRDPKAPIFQTADYGIVGDLKEVIPALLQRLRTGKGLAAKIKPAGCARTSQSYRESLSKMRPNIHKFGRLITDVACDPLTKRTVEGHAQLFDAARDPKHQDLFTTTSHLTGKRVSRYLSLLQSPEDVFALSRMKRAAFNLTGTCTGGRCVGGAALNAMWSVTWDLDQAQGTDYHQRLRRWLRDAQERDITVAGALTDPKGNRKLPPSRQADPDSYLRVVARRQGGVVVRGAKVMICGVAAAQEIFVMPGTRLKRSEADYAVSFVIPRDVPGLTIVEARRPSDTREQEEGFDNPVARGGITQAYLFFEDVFVPKERIFLHGEYAAAEDAVTRFTLPYRSAIGGCVAGQGDVMVGAAILMARANGLQEKVFRDKLVRMLVNNETTFGVGLAAAVLGRKHPSGSWLPDSLMANINKVHVATLPYETKRLTQEIAGGIAETGCMPSAKDFLDERYGHLIRKYLKAHAPAETRARIARLIEWLTIGAGVPGCMHGGGSPDGARLSVFADAKLKEMADLAKRLGGISDISLEG
ncbi:MAG: FAD-binding protein [Elusimicrobia bacterium]|nr:FAD-binding protein [Elusimicrobiota bacterium]